MAVVTIIGGGLAGSEAAWQAASAGAWVVLHEMRPAAADRGSTRPIGLAELGAAIPSAATSSITPSVC